MTNANKHQDLKQWLLTQIGYASAHAATYGDTTRIREISERMAYYLDEGQIEEIFRKEIGNVDELSLEGS